MDDFESKGEAYKDRFPIYMNPYPPEPGYEDNPWWGAMNDNKMGEAVARFMGMCNNDDSDWKIERERIEREIVPDKTMVGSLAFAKSKIDNEMDELIAIEKKKWIKARDTVTGLGKEYGRRVLNTLAPLARHPHKWEDFNIDAVEAVIDSVEEVRQRDLINNT